MVYEHEINIFNEDALKNKFSTIDTQFNVTLGKISAIISDSEIEQYVDGHTTMNSRLSSVVQDLSGVHTQISTMQTDYEDGFQSVDSRLTTVDETITGIRAEVSSVHSEYNGLNTRVSSAETKITDSAIISTVTETTEGQDALSSVIEQKADSIRLKADKISWQSTYSSMTNDGTLTCTGANITGLVNIVNGSDSCTIGTTHAYAYRTVEGLVDINLKCLNYIVKSGNNVIAEHTWANDNNRLNDVTATTGSYINRILALTNQSSLPIINTSSDLSKLCWLQETFTRNSTGGHYELIISHGWMYSIADSSFKFDKDGAWINGNKITTSSSKRYKHNIAMLDAKFDPHKLLQLIPKQFVYNDGEEQYRDTKGLTIPGFIAEEVAEIYPSAVIHNQKGEIESWDERRIIPGMLALIQELYSRVKNLEVEK